VGIPYAEIFAVFGGIMNMIPVFGPIIATIICGLILLITSPQDIIIYFVIVILVSIIDANFIEPNMLGDSLGLKPVWITIAIIVMSSLFGLFGTFFGVPIFAVIYTLIKEEVDKRVALKDANEACKATPTDPAGEADQADEEPVKEESSEENKEKIAPQGEEAKNDEVSENSDSEDNK
jgi:predicted PurR-regulated permease PerM